MMKSNSFLVHVYTICSLSCLAAFLCCTSVLAAESGYVMSMPYAISAENIYKVRIVKIDGRDQQPATKYRVGTGSHVLTVSLMLDVYWTPNLTGSQEKIYTRNFDVIIEDGMIYQVGAKVDVDAPIESQLDGSFWEPILYKAYEH
jgi:hypothetical protein